MRKTNYGLYVLLLAIFLATLQYYTHKHSPITSNEAATIFSTAYWTHLIEGENSHEDWLSMDAADNPPFAKYYYGVVLWAYGLDEKTIANKNWWFLKSGDEGDPTGFQRSLNQRIGLKRLSIARVTAAISFVFLALSAYALGTVVGGKRLGFFTAIAISLNQSTLSITPLVLTDELFISLICLENAALIKWIKSYAKDFGAGSHQWILAAGLLLAMIVTTQTNGILQLPITIAAIIICISSFGASRWPILFEITLGLILAVTVTLLLNPAVYQMPLDTVISFIKYRVALLKSTETLSGAGGMSIFSRIMLACQILLIDKDWGYFGKYLPLGLIFSTIGIVSALKRTIEIESGESWKRKVAILLFIAVAIWIPPTFWIYKFTLNPQNLFPILPWLCLLVAFGIDTLIDPILKMSFWQALKKLVNSVPLATIIIILLSWSLIESSSAKEAYIISINRPIFKIRQLERILLLHPDDIHTRLRLVIERIAVAQDAKALEALTPLLEKNPNNKFMNALYKVLEERVKR